MHKTTTLNCTGCGKPFEKSAPEVRRQRKVDPDRQFYCTMPCYGRHAGQHNLGPEHSRGNPKHLNPGNRLDEFSPFRYHMRKARNRKHGTNLDLEYLKALWERQGGRCAISGLGMTLPPTSLAGTTQRGSLEAQPRSDR